MLETRRDEFLAHEGRLQHLLERTARTIPAAMEAPVACPASDPALPSESAAAAFPSFNLCRLAPLLETAHMGGADVMRERTDRQ